MNVSSQNPWTLDGQWALVTGASRGIGEAVAVALARAGARTILAARDHSQLQRVAGICRSAGAPEVVPIVVDLSERSEVDGLASRVLHRAGSLDILVNNAGVAWRGNAQEGDPDEWDRMVALNLSTPMRLTRRLAPGMVEQRTGVILNIGSIAGLEGMTTSGAYAATKHGLRGWSLSCYQNLRHHNIKVVLINPGFVNTDMVRELPGVLPHRMIQPDDIAMAVRFALECSVMCCPEEINLRLTRSAYAP